jgi:flavodoxin
MFRVIATPPRCRHVSGVEIDQRRRRITGALAALPLGMLMATETIRPRGGQAPTKILVAFCSRSGNTRVIAGLLHRRLGASLFEIQPARPYPEDYLETVALAKRERDSQFEPPLATRVANVADYDTVYLGFPIWGETAPPIIRSFLSAHDLGKKTVIPFITHGGYGVGNSIDVLRSHAPNTDLKDAFVMEADQERRTMNQVDAWLKRG